SLNYTIQNDEGPMPTVSLSIGGSVTEAGGTATVTVTAHLNNNDKTQVPITVPLDFGGTAIQGTDYSLSATSVTFPKNTKDGDTKTITITGLEDDGTGAPGNPIVLNESDATLTVTIHPAPTDKEGNTQGYTVGQNNTAMTTITEDNNDPLPVISFKTLTPNSPDQAHSASVEVDLTLPSDPTKIVATDQTITVQYAATDGTAFGSGPNQDYSLPPGMLTFNPGDTKAFIPVTLINTGADEANDDTAADETFTITLSNPSNNATLSANPTATFSIKEGANQAPSITSITGPS